MSHLNVIKTETLALVPLYLFTNYSTVLVMVGSTNLPKSAKLFGFVLKLSGDLHSIWPFFIT
jgi:hypothetical protein